MATTPFRPALFRFLRDLAANNDRDWFKANRERYERDAREPMLRFLADLELPMAKIAPEMLVDARPNGGSMFRIHRDTRFAKDKSPYKTHLAAQMRHRGAKDMHAPCYYLHLEPDNVITGAGIWHPDGPSQRRIRRAILGDPDGWNRIVRAKWFRENLRFEGESLKRPPAGVPAEHPQLDDLKRKDFIVVARWSQSEATSGEFFRRFLDFCRRTKDFNDFLANALGLDPAA